MRLAFPDDPSEPISSGDAAALMAQANQWYALNSYGQLGFTSEVTPLLMMPQAKSWYGVQPPVQLVLDARNEAQAAGFTNSAYDLDIARYNPVPGWTFSGIAVSGGKGLWLQHPSLGVLVHELGHNFGLEHANSWSATADSVIGAGTNVEYGNIFDTMGVPDSNPTPSHFNVAEKNALKWLPASLVLSVTNSGTYRLQAFDVPQLNPTQACAVRITKDSSREYWLEFRASFPGNPWTQNGVLLNWGPWEKSRGGTHLLDMTPGTPTSGGGLEDAALVVGRTFSDFSAGIHITPLGVDSDGSNRWVDVRVSLGSFVGNPSPSLSITSSSTSAVPGQVVQFVATASDPEGDSLAFAWDFGDLSFGSNSLNAAKSWASPGEYVVRCTASDMKGGITTRTVLIEIGSPATWRIAGRVADAGGSPLEGVRVHNGLVGTEYRGAYTDSGGNYVLPNLAAGSHVLYAVKYPFDVLPTGWVNPLDISSGQSARDWTATPYPVVQIAATDPTASASGFPLDTGTFTLTRSGSLASHLTVGILLSGDASYSEQYELNPVPENYPVTVTFAPGNQATNLVVIPFEDPELEGSLRVIATISEEPGYLPGASREATVFISNGPGPGVPALFWSKPADVVYGTALGPTQLSATCAVQGMFSYNPPLGTVLNAGSNQQLWVFFTPTDSQNYVPVATNVAINVLKKSLTVTANDAAMVFGGALPGFSAAYAGFVNGDTVASLDTPVSLTTTALIGSDVGNYPITAIDGADANYQITFVDGELTITRASVTGSLSSLLNPALPGAELEFSYVVNSLAPSSATPTGIVDFKVGTNTFSVPLSNGAATLRTLSIPVGRHPVLAEYFMNPNFVGATNRLDPDQIVNTPPVPAADVLERYPPAGVQVSVAVLLSNDFDADGHSLVLSSVSTNSANGGTLSLAGNLISYTPPLGSTNDDTFTYTMTDGLVSQPVTSIVHVRTLAILPPHLVLTATGNGGYRVEFDGIPGLTYRVEYSGSLNPIGWQTLTLLSTNAAGRFEHVDFPPAGSTQRFYRSAYP